jgi:hypothetical protein
MWLAMSASNDREDNAPGALDERITLLSQIRADQPDLEAAVSQARLLGGDEVVPAIDALELALDALVSNPSGVGPNQTCTELLSGEEVAPDEATLAFCSRFVDTTGPIDPQVAATPFVGVGELEQLDEAVVAFTTSASAEIQAG